MKLSEILRKAGAPQDQIDAAEKTEKDLATANTESKDRRIELDGLKTKMAAFDGIDLDALKKSQKDLEGIEEKNLLKAGEFEKVKKTIEDNHAAAMEKITGSREDWKGKYKSLAVDKALLSAAAHHKAIEPEEIAVLTRRKIHVDDETGAISVRDGDNELTDKDGKPLDINGYIGGFLSERPYLVQGKGGGAGSGGGKGEEDKSDQSSRGKISRGLAARDKA